MQYILILFKVTFSFNWDKWGYHLHAVSFFPIFFLYCLGSNKIEHLLLFCKKKSQTSKYFFLFTRQFIYKYANMYCPRKMWVIGSWKNNYILVKSGYKKVLKDFHTAHLKITLPTGRLFDLYLLAFRESCPQQRCSALLA